MAAVTRVKGRPVTPVGYEVNDKVELSEAVTAGDLLKYTGAINRGQSIMSRAALGSTEVDGIALQDGYAGERGFSVGIHGEIDGFSGMTPGTALYPAPAGGVVGGIDTTAAGAIRMKAVSASRIRYNFV